MDGSHFNVFYLEKQVILLTDKCAGQPGRAGDSGDISQRGVWSEAICYIKGLIKIDLN